MAVDNRPHVGCPVDGQQNTGHDESCQSFEVAHCCEQRFNLFCSGHIRNEHDCGCGDAPTDELERIKTFEVLPKNSDKTPDEIRTEAECDARLG